MRLIEALAIAAKVLKNPLDQHRIFEARGHAQRPVEAPAEFDVDCKDALESLRPRQSPLPVGGRWLAALLGLIGSGGAGSGHDPGPIRARRGEQAMILRQGGGEAYPQTLAGSN